MRKNKMLTFHELSILNDHLKNGPIHYNDQLSPHTVKKLMFNGYLTCLEHWFILTKKGYKTISRYKILFLLWNFFKKIKGIKIET